MARRGVVKETELSRRKGRHACIEGLPTVGLGISASDTEQIGVRTYEEVDDTLKEYLEGDSLFGNPTVIGRHLASEYKRRNPYCITRGMLGLEDI
mgnify:CR=1 FL=1